MKISLIQPSRNNLKYLKWSYDSIRKNQGDHEVEICVADDASTDGTWEWCQERMHADPYFKAIRNETGKRLGHTILYDRLVNEVASHEICMIYHADMYLCPGALDAIEHEMVRYDMYTDGETIISLTRIEPPLHPDGPEKILKDFGVEPENFDEEGLLAYLKTRVPKQDTTEGIFAPWAFWKRDFQEIGGHDPMYAPQSKEDSDIFNRFQLNGVRFVQTWHGCVYHMTCRGSRRNTVDKAKNIYEDSPEWLAQNMRSTRNFIRKWGHFVKHDRYMKPEVAPKYRTGFFIKNANIELLQLLEPWCDNIYVDCPWHIVEQYISAERGNTVYDLHNRIKPNEEQYYRKHDIKVYIDAKRFTQDDYNHIQHLSQVLELNDELGEFTFGNMNVAVSDMTSYEYDLIVCKNNIYKK